MRSGRAPAVLVPRRGGAAAAVPAALHVLLAGGLAAAIASGAGFAWHAALHAALFVPLALLLLPLLGRFRAERASAAGRRRLLLVLTAAAIARGFFLVGPPVLSDDLYRVIWEGRVVAAGGDPWAQPPDDPGLAALAAEHPEVHRRVGYWKLPAIYPPASQLFAAAVTGVSTDPRAMKAALLLAEALLAGALLCLLRSRRLPPLLVAGYLWNPLVLVEVAGSGHLDVLGAAFLALAFAALGRGRPVLGSALAGVSGMVKFAGFAALPFLVRGVSGGRRKAAALLAAAAAVLLPLLPFLGPGRLEEGIPARLAEFGFSLFHYARHWRFNESLFTALEAFGGSLARPAVPVLLLLLGLYCWFRRTPAMLATALLAGGAFLLAPAAHPWYLLWVLPFALLHPERRGLFAGCLAMTLTAVLGYQPFWTTPVGEPWTVPLGLRLAEYLPVAAAALLACRFRFPQEPRKARVSRPTG